MKINKQAITIVELIVVITILAVLGTIAFLSFQSYTLSARDTVRISDLNKIKSTLEYTQLELGVYAIPDNGVEITFSGATAWTQGTFGDKARQQTKRLDKVPTDPLTQNEYTFSITGDKTEFELGAIIEGDDFAFNHKRDPLLQRSHAASDHKTFIAGNYNGQIVKTRSGSVGNLLALPSIILSSTTYTDLGDILSNKTLSLKGYTNVPASYNMGTGSLDFDFSGRDILLFSGSLTDLKTDEKQRVQVLSKLINAYLGTTVISNIDNFVVYDEENAVAGLSAKKYIVDFLNTRYFSKDVEQIPQPQLSFTTFPDDLRQIFASSSVFTSNWSTNNCDPTSMSIIKVDPGTDTIPSTLAENTVYQLSAGSYISSTKISMTSCSGLIGGSETNLYSSVEINNTSLLEISSKSNVIISGVNIDGEQNGGGGTHGKNLYGILSSVSNNITLNDIEIQGNIAAGLYLNNSSSNVIHNITSYDTTNYGIRLHGGSNNNELSKILTFNNSIGFIINASHSNVIQGLRSYNDGSDAVRILSSHANSLSNVMIYNAGVIGLFVSGSNNNVISNSIIYATPNPAQINGGLNNLVSNSSFFNGHNGVAFVNTTGGNYLNNIYSYNNAYNEVFLVNTTDNKYYGFLDLLGTNTGIFTGLSAGSDSDGIAQNLSLDSGKPGIIDSFNDAYAVIPDVSGWDYELLGKQTGLTFDGTESYTFGSNLPFQSKLIRFNSISNQFEYYGVDRVDYYGSKKIGEW